MKLTIQQLRKIIKESILLEYGVHGDFSQDRMQHLEDMYTEDFINANGREPNAEERRQISMRAYEDVQMGY